MAKVKPGSIAVADRGRQDKTISELGGDVTVLEMDLPTRLAMESINAKHERSASDWNYVALPLILAKCVVGEGDVPVMDEAAWRVWGARNRNAAVELANTALSLSGFDQDDVAKN